MNVHERSIPTVILEDLEERRKPGISAECNLLRLDMEFIRFQQNLTILFIEWDIF